MDKNVCGLKNIKLLLHMYNVVVYLHWLKDKIECLLTGISRWGALTINHSGKCKDVFWKNTNNPLACSAGIFCTFLGGGEGRVGQKLLVYVNVIVAAIFDFMTEEDWESNP